MPLSEELLKIANQLGEYEDFHLTELDALEKAANTVAKSWSGSWLGYQAYVYFAEFEHPSPRAVFSQVWGLNSDATQGDWVEYQSDDVKQFLYKQSGITSVHWCDNRGKKAKKTFEEARESVLSLVHVNRSLLNDKYVSSLTTAIESINIDSASAFVKQQMPSGQGFSMDDIALEKGMLIPPHIEVLAYVHAARAPFHACANLKDFVLRLAKHVQNLAQTPIQENRMGNKIFVGHGQSPVWREFKDFLSEKLNLDWDEFNRVPVAGVANTTRLAEMLNQACMAFLIMTAEDEDVDGNFHARMNVVHESGLFQGRLGFERAIILLEDGCQGFSNIEGLGQIRFPKGNISTIFEDVRQVLQREGIIK